MAAKEQQQARTSSRRGRPPLQDWRIEPDDARRLRGEMHGFMTSCYKQTDALVSVMGRGLEFVAEARKTFPALDATEGFMMWVHRKRQRKEISAASAQQYLTIFRMAQIPREKAFRRALTGNMDRFAEREARQRVLVEGRQVLSLILRSEASWRTAALALQWSIAARFVDLARLNRSHIKMSASNIMFVLVGGKTDRVGEGQAVITPRHGPFLTHVAAYLASHSQATAFPSLCRVSYNKWLQSELGLTSHYLRHSALSAVAVQLGEGAARGLARHRTETSIREYIPMYTWAPSQATVTGAALLQSL